MLRALLFCLALLCGRLALADASLATHATPFVSAAEATAIDRYAATQLKRAFGKDARAADFVRRQIAANLDEKHALPPLNGSTFPLTAGDIRRTVVDYEIFKFQTFVSSGVFPKRYFGYFDGKWDTAAYERRLKEVVHGAVGTANAFLEKSGSAVRLTDAEVAVTFIAEGGAILLREKQDSLERIHPVQGIGLDDIATGFTRYSDLVHHLDDQFKTHLTDIVVWVDSPQGKSPALSRMMTFDEALLGVCVMYVFEKEITEKKLAAEHASLKGLPLADQFVTTSLVYNSGNVFNEARREEIRDLKTAAYLRKVSDQNAKKRWPLPVDTSEGSRQRLVGDGGAYPDQQTSWSGVYHVLQRYGGLVGLLRFTDVFDAAGMFRAK